MGKVKQQYKGSVSWFTNFQAWVLVAGLIVWGTAFAISFLPNSEDDSLRITKEILMSVGSAIVAGVLIGSIMSYRQLKSFYLNELSEVIFGEKFLNSRTDIESVWDRVTKAFFCAKFAEINDDLLNNCQEYIFLERACLVLPKLFAYDQGCMGRSGQKIYKSYGSVFFRFNSRQRKTYSVFPGSLDQSERG